MHRILSMIAILIWYICYNGNSIVQPKILLESISPSSMINLAIQNNSAGFRYRRSLNDEYPNGPLENKIPSTFIVKKSKKEHCGLFTNKADEETSYKVMLIEKEFGDEYSNYYVVPGSVNFKRTTDPEVEEFHIQRRYADQIAYAVCSPGWLEKVWVNSGKDDDEEETDVRINARRCGIASVLMEFCLRDPKMNQIKDSNKVFEKLQEADVSDIEARESQLKENCDDLMGLEMSANPADAAYGYFNAAIRANYLQMIIQERFHDTKDNLAYSIYSTLQAKEHYDAKTGTIGTCGDNEECNGVDAYWYFCKK